MGEVWSNCRGLAELPRFGRIAEVWLNCRGLAELPRPGRSRAGHVSGGRRCFSGRDCTESAFCGTPAANAASILAERGISPSRDCTKSAFCGTPAANAASTPAKRGVSPAAIAQNRPSTALQLQTRQAFRPKGAFLRPRLHKIGVLRHSSCKRGKHSGQKGRSFGRDCTKTAFCGTPAANAAGHSGRKGRSPAAIT